MQRGSVRPFSSDPSTSCLGVPCQPDLSPRTLCQERLRCFWKSRCLGPITDRGLGMPGAVPRTSELIGEDQLPRWSCHLASCWTGLPVLAAWGSLTTAASVPSVMLPGEVVSGLPRAPVGDWSRRGPRFGSQYLPVLSALSALQTSPRSA